MATFKPELTQRQEEFCRFVDDFQQEHAGLSPSFDEIAKGMQLKERCSARDHFRLIQKKGYVTVTPGASRSIRLTDKWRRYLNHKLNAKTNPVVDAVAVSHPELFEDWTMDDWNELRSIRGLGGEMTADAVIEEAQKMNENRDLLAKCHALLVCQSTRQAAIHWLNKAYGKIDGQRRLDIMRKAH